MAASWGSAWGSAWGSSWGYSASPTWLSNLPGPSFDFGLNPIDETANTDIVAGATRARRRTTVREDIARVTWVFTDAQLSIFRTWFDADACGGVAWFSMNVPVGTIGFATKLARFTGAFHAILLDGFMWRVTADLEIT